MIPVTISPKFQVVIPKEIREQMGLEPGQKLHAIAYSSLAVSLAPHSQITLIGMLNAPLTDSPLQILRVFGCKLPLLWRSFLAIGNFYFKLLEPRFQD